MNCPLKSLPAPLFVLTPPTTSHSLARACRDAWRVFVQQSLQWSHSELVQWSSYIYAPIARDVARATLNSSPVLHDFSSNDVRFAERIIRSARARTVETLFSFARPLARIEFVCALRESGAVTRCVDENGEPVYGPTPAGESLTDCVLAIVAADLLTHPADFEGETLCRDCGGVTVDPKPCCFSAELAREIAIALKPAVSARVLRAPSGRYSSHAEAA